MMAPTRSDQQHKAISRKRKQEQMGVGCTKKNKSSTDNGGINELPEDVLINILSRLSLKEAGRASVLARRWRYLWRFFHGILQFDYRDNATGNVMKSEKLESWVNTVLKHHQGRYIEGVLVTFNPKEGGNDVNNPKKFGTVDSWVHFAKLKEVERFELKLPFNNVYTFPFVECLIKSHSHGASPHFRRLRSLRLAHVDIKDVLFHYFLAQCPNLEELCIQFSQVTTDLKVIDPPSLRVLEVSRCLKIQSLEVSAEHLVSLTYGGGKKSLKLKNVPNLRELTISGDFCISFVIEPEEHWSYSVQLEKLVLDFQLMNTERIILAPPDLPRLCSLKRLEVQVCAAYSNSLLFFTSLLKASPQLSEFRIEMFHSAYPSRTENDRKPFLVRLPWDAKLFVGSKVKVIEIAGYIGCESDDELVLALMKAGRPSIERVVIDTQTAHYDYPEFKRHIAFHRSSRTRGGLPYAIGATTRNKARERAKKLVSKFPRRIKSSVT